MFNDCKKIMALLLIFAVLLNSLLFTVSATAAEYNTATNYSKDPLAGANLTAALRATRANTTFNYSENAGGYQIVSSSGSTPKNFMYVTDKYVSGKNAYLVSVDYKLGSTNAAAGVGFIIGAVDNHGFVSGDNTTSESLVGANVYKSYITHYSTTSAGAPKKRIRISSGDAASGNPWDNGTTFNKAVWIDDDVIVDSAGWNNMSLYISDAGIKNYINGRLVWEIADITSIEGYIGLFSALPNAVFKNLKVEEINGSSMDGFTLVHALRGTSSNTKLDYTMANGSYALTGTGNNSKNFFFLSSENNMTADKPYTVSVDFMGAAAGKGAGIIIGASSLSFTDDGTSVVASGLTTAYRAWIYRDDTNGDYIRFMSCDGADPASTSGLSFTKKQIFSNTDLYKTDGWNNLQVKVCENSVICYLNDVKIFSTTDLSSTEGYIGVSSETSGIQFKNFVVSQNDGQVDLDNVKLAAALRSTPTQTTLEKVAGTDTYKVVTSASNSKHYLFMSPVKAVIPEEGLGYELSVDYKINSTDTNASVGFIIGANKFTGTVSGSNTVPDDMSSAYKSAVYKNQDKIFINMCDKTNAWDNGTNHTALSDVGVTYNTDDWNRLRLVVTYSGLVQSDFQPFLSAVIIALKSLKINIFTDFLFRPVSSFNFEMG